MVTFLRQLSAAYFAAGVALLVTGRPYTAAGSTLAAILALLISMRQGKANR